MSYDDDGFVEAAREHYRNPRPRMRTTSRYLGVRQRSGSWTAYHNLPHARGQVKQVVIGNFSDERDAALAAQDWRDRNLADPPQCPALVQERLKAAALARLSGRDAA